MKTLPKTASKVISTLQNAGYEAYAVGGSVRDILMGKPTKGWDFTTNATPEEILKIFPNSFYDNKFGTVGIKIYHNNDNQPLETVLDSEISRNPEEINSDPIKPDDIFEITTYRSEKGYSDSRHPDVVSWGKSIEEDLSRRDFTINAVAWDGNTFIDPYGGQVDLESKTIKAVGDAEKRFSEDALRMMRAVRIASELGFVIDQSVLSAITSNSQRITKISIERIRDELLRIIGSQYGSDGILVLRSVGILKIILPELDATFGIDQKSPKRHHIFDVGTHLILALKHVPSKDTIVRFATLLHDIGKTATYHKDETGLITFYNHEVVGAKLARAIATRLRLSKSDSTKLITLIRWHQFSVDERQTDSALRRFIRRVGKDNLSDILDLRIGDRLGGGAQETSWRLELYKKRLAEVQIQPFSIADLAIDGHDVMREYDVPSGPIVGKTLKALFILVDTGKVPNETDVLLGKLREMKSTLMS